MAGTGVVDFEGTEEEYAAFLEQEIANGNLTEEAAEAMLNAFVITENDITNLEAYLDNPEGFVPREKDENVTFNPEAFMPLRSIVEPAPEKELSFLEQLQQAELSAMSEAASTGEPMPSMDVLRNRVAIGRDYPVQGLTDEELIADGSPEALAELENRSTHRDQSFLESLSNPYSYARMAGSAGRSMVQIGNMPESILGLLKAGGENVTGLDLGSQETFANVARKQREAERALGTTPAMTPGESFVESLTGALVPGGLVTKGIGIGTDFLVDQTVRELTDEKGEKYETVFDQIGLTNNDSGPILGTMAAIGVGLLAGSVSAAALERLATSKLSVVRPKQLQEIDTNAPANLASVEKASDLTKANVIDEQQALRDIIRRNGVANIDEIDARIEFDTHASQRTRIAEAANTGQLTTRDATFKSPIAPRVLFDAYNTLSPNVKQNVARYINLKDMRDDIMIALEKGEATKDALFYVDSEIDRIAKAFPDAEAFSSQYNQVTGALREFAQGSLFSEKYKVHLDKTRQNYVPLEISDVDPTAPFLQRLKQSQSEGVGQADPEWFLQNRKIGSYDMERRADPMIMLMQSVEATLTARMKNDTKLALVDSLLESSVGSQTMRRATSDEVSKYADRIVQVYRNGKKEHYITSKLTAELMKFDPYIAKYPALFVPKRIFEQAAVGPVSLTFAPVTALRDAVGGMVTRPQKLLAGNPIDVAAAVPKQLWAKTQGAVSSFFQQSIVKGEMPLPEWLMSAEQQKHFSDNVANSYTRTLYHQANEAGGFDASLMKNKIELGQGALAEVKRTLDRASANVDIPGARFSARRLNNMIDGFVSVFNAIQDSPRFAAIEKTVKNTDIEVDEATALSRQLTGDVTKSGRVYTAAGKRMDVDAVDQGVLNFANKGIGGLTEVLRESTPFLNPMIQGNRRLLQSIVEDPIGFNLRAWKAIGLPSLAIFGWNEMLGKEYNDYAMQQRSARDVVMNLYMGIPGLPPEQGIEIPLMHELLTFSAPFTRGLYGMSRGENDERTRGALSIVAENIFNNSLDVGFPVIGQVAANMSGISAPESLANPSDGVYKIREDDLGVLPENMEHLARTLFAGIGDTAVHIANAVAGDPSFETFYTELKDRTLARTPIVKNVAGKKRSNTHFSIPNELIQEKFDAVREFRSYYDAFYNPKRFNEDNLQKPASKGNYTKFKVDNPLSAEDLPFLMQGPEGLKEPVNPFYKEFGALIVDDAQRGAAGMTALEDRERTYAKYTKRLREFNAGNKQALREWQAMLSGIEPEEEGTKQLQELLRDNEIDLTNYDDRVKLINLIEARRADIINGQTDVFDKLEAKITMALRERGLLEEDKHFRIEKHLRPDDANPLGL